MTSMEITRKSRAMGTVKVPGDKSASHRALMISSLADGSSHISNMSDGHDVHGTLNIMQSMGAEITKQHDGWLVVGPKTGLNPFNGSLDCGNSGTTMRLLMGITSAVPGAHFLIGDESLQNRPMDRVAEPLRNMGSIIEGRSSRCYAPLRVQGKSNLNPINYRIPVPSAQVKSAILFAGLFAGDTTTVFESVRTRSTTEIMFEQAGISIKTSNIEDGRKIVIEPGRPQAHKWFIPGDPSQAAFFVVLGLIAQQGSITIEAIDSSPERTGFLSVLKRMGGDITEVPASQGSFEVIATSSSLVSTEIHSSEIPSVDEVPILAVAAAAASGSTKFLEMGELRIKESDRFAASINLARGLGCEVHVDGDNFTIHGLESASNFNFLSIDAKLDHRIVMSSAVALTVGRGGSIHGSDTVESSYPSFFKDLMAVTA
jgi:3-phosphoshikimate 1-carboxyvinyltransferase